MLSGVTVITVTRDVLRAGREAMLEQCLCSVREQTLRPVEHIVVDGASTDGTTALLEMYRRRGWIRLVSEPDRGIYDAMNKGLAMAQGRYAAFLNSDDFYHDPAWLARSVQALEGSGASCSSAPVRCMDEEGRCRIGLAPRWADMFCSMNVNHQSLLMRTDVLRRLGGFSLRFPVQADWELLLRFLLGGGRYAVLPEAGCTYRDFGLSARTPRQELMAERLAILEQTLRPLGADAELCRSICDFGHVPGPLARRIEERLHPAHRAAFAERNRQTARRKVRRWCWTYSRRPDRAVLRILGVTLWDRRFPQPMPESFQP
jgi:glycosyltransferase involved in cell wall biosynthesis